MTFHERFGLPIEIGPSFVFAIEVMRVVAKDLRPEQYNHPAVQAAIIRLEDAANVMQADLDQRYPPGTLEQLDANNGG